MKLYIKIVAVSLVCLVVSVGYFAFAADVISRMFHQTLTTPIEKDMQIFTPSQYDGVEIFQGQEISDYWVWSGTQFFLEIEVVNVGNTALDVQLNVPSMPAGWDISLFGNGTLAMGTSRIMTVVAFPPSDSPEGTSTGDFDLYITG